MSKHSRPSVISEGATVGVIGAGGIANKLHLPQIAAMPSARVKSIAGRKESRLRILADRGLMAARAPGRGDWKGRTILITAGPTRAYLDDVRYLTNGSSGRMAAALARAALGQKSFEAVI